LAESAELARWLSQKAILGIVFLSSHFWTYELTKISKNQKHLSQKVLDIKEHNVNANGNE